MSEIKTGLGHQLQADQRALGACSDSLIESMNHISDINNPDVNRLRDLIHQCSMLAIELKFSSNEKYSQND